MSKLLAPTRAEDMSARKQWTFGLLVGATIGLVLYVVTYVPHGLSEIGIAAAASTLAGLWLLWRDAR